MNISVKQLQGWIQEIEEGVVGTLVSKTNTIYFIRIHKKKSQKGRWLRCTWPTP